MTLFFFLLSLLFGWLAYNLYRPIFRHPQLAAVSFLAGWLTGELALHHILWQVLLVGILTWLGAVEGLLGALGLLICICAWFAMGYFYLQGQHAETEMEYALSENLGSGYEDEIEAAQRSHFPEGPDFAAIKKPFRPVDSAIEVVKDQSFGTNGQTLDLYRSRNSVTGKPVLFQIHGGAWTEKMGSKNEQGIPLMTHMAKRDWICVANSYRLSPTATMPEHVVDCKQALVWIKENIAQYGGDPDFIVVTGGSAGGHLCSLLALTANDSDFQPGFEDKDTALQGAVPYYGAYDFTNEHQFQKHDGAAKMFERSIMKCSLEGHREDYERVSPLFRIHASAPPFLIIHGDKDTLVPVEEARVFSTKLREVSSSSVTYAEISGAQHAFDMFPSLRSEHVKQGIERFLAYLFTQYNNQKKSGDQDGSSAP